MLILLVQILFSVSLFAGDSVNNGGGLAEQAVVFSARQFHSFTDSCGAFRSCGVNPEVAPHLRTLETCALPGEGALRFSTPEKAPELEGKVFASLADGNLLINRDFLYSKSDEPLKLPGAVAHLARIYLEHCGGPEFAATAEVGKTLAAFAEFDGERVTVGKDDLNLPSKKWIRVRSFYSDLVFDASASLVRLACPVSLGDCSLVQGEAGPSRFRNLSLSEERKMGDVISFRIEGSFDSMGARAEWFELSAEYKDGKMKRFFLNGRELELPKEER